MTKENKEKKRTGRMAFTWETEVEVKKTNRMFVLGTDIEVGGALSLRCLEV